MWTEVAKLTASDASSGDRFGFSISLHDNRAAIGAYGNDDSGRSSGVKKEEKKMVRAQLLDIFKSIPSLAIFMLPGGALLLPLVVKFIPNLLPSSFNKGIEEEE